MPYIKDEDRKRIWNSVVNADVDGPNNAGELNYILTEFCTTYFEINGGRYQQINDIVGALESCKLEFYRRLVAPYEDRKIKENGDVY